jgi:hypothetical protein
MAVHSPPPGGTVTRVRYAGPHAGTLGDYIDLGTGKALTAEPGGVYDVAPASGRNVPDVPGNCVVLDGEEAAGWQAVAEPEPEHGEPAEDRGDEDRPDEPAE